MELPKIKLFHTCNTIDQKDPDQNSIKKEKTRKRVCVCERVGHSTTNHTKNWKTEVLNHMLIIESPISKSFQKKPRDDFLSKLSLNYKLFQTVSIRLK